MTEGKRAISRKDLKLWKKVAETVTPMEGKSSDLQALIDQIETTRSKAGPFQPDPDHPVQKQTANQASLEELKALEGQGVGSKAISRSKTPPPLHSLDRREKRRVAQGRIAIEARLDLHGMTQREAHTALRGFLHSCQLQGYKHVLVITGKGSRVESDPYSDGQGKGILRRVVPKWLSEPGIRMFIVGFEEAHRSLGGGGALHIRMRSRKNQR